MSFVAEREPLSAMPDNPLRTAAPKGWTEEQERRRAERLDDLYDTILGGVSSVLEGRQRHVRIGPHLYDEGELVELILFEQEPDQLTSLLLGNANLGDKLIKEFAQAQAELYVDVEGI